MKAYSVIVLVMAGVIALSAVAEQGGGSTDKVTITLKSAAEVGGGKALLGDIATISGGTKEVEEYLSQIVVCSSLEDSKSVVIRPGDVMSCLSRSRIDLSYISIDGAVQVSVSSKSRTISADEIKQAVIDHVRENMLWDSDDVEVEFTRSVSDIRLSSDGISICVDEPLGCDYLGYEQFALKLLKDGELVERISVPTRIRVHQDVVVSSRMISRNSILGRDNAELKRIELTDTSKAPITSLDDVAGKRITITVPAGRVIYHSLIETAPVIDKDQYVVIRGKKGALRITTRGKALEEGKPGDFIRVLNLSSSQVLVAKVTDQQTVDIIGMSVE